jgi:hypothetical protein
VPKLLDKKSPIQGSNPCGYPHKPLVSYRINRQLSGWIPPPPMIRAFGAHCQKETNAVQQKLPNDVSAPPSPVSVHKSGSSIGAADGR